MTKQIKSKLLNCLPSEHQKFHRKIYFYISLTNSVKITFGGDLFDKCCSHLPLKFLLKNIGVQFTYYTSPENDPVA